MRMTSTGAFPRALAAARPPKPPPTMTTRGAFDVCSSALLIELRLASFIHPFLKLLRPEISENLRDFAPARHSAPTGPEFFRRFADGTGVANSCASPGITREISRQKDLFVIGDYLRTGKRNVSEKFRSC